MKARPTPAHTAGAAAFLPALLAIVLLCTAARTATAQEPPLTTFEGSIRYAGTSEPAICYVIVSRTEDGVAIRLHHHRRRGELHPQHPLRSRQRGHRCLRHERKGRAPHRAQCQRAARLRGGGVPLRTERGDGQGPQDGDEGRRHRILQRRILPCPGGPGHRGRAPQAAHASCPASRSGTTDRYSTRPSP